MTDRDMDLDYVKIEISAQHGVFSLNEQHIAQLDFTSQFCTEVSCEGDGYRDTHMSFFARPVGALLALQGMQYLCTQEKVWDYLQISIYDGARDVIVNTTTQERSGGACAPPGVWTRDGCESARRVPASRTRVVLARPSTV